MARRLACLLRSGRSGQGRGPCMTAIVGLALLRLPIPLCAWIARDAGADLVETDSRRSLGGFAVAEFSGGGMALATAELLAPH